MNEPLVALLVLADDGEYLSETVQSAEEHLNGFLMEKWMYDDSGDDSHREELRLRFPDFEHFDGGERQGHDGSIRHAWDYLLEHSYSHYVFHLEQGFIFKDDVHLRHLAAVLEHSPALAQVALKSYTCAHMDDVQNHTKRDFTYRGEYLLWCVQKQFFTTNPCLYRRDLMKHGWPDDGIESFSTRLRDQGFQFAIMEATEEEPPVHHISDVGTDQETKP